jgi:ankyrin repeat protein
VSELLNGGADVNYRDNTLETPLHFAVREFTPDLAELLLRHGAEVDAQDEHGNTPLFRAVFGSQGRGQMIRLLLAHSANKTLKKPAWYVAPRSGRIDRQLQCEAIPGLSVD